LPRAKAPAFQHSTSPSISAGGVFSKKAGGCEQNEPGLRQAICLRIKQRDASSRNAGGSRLTQGAQLRESGCASSRSESARTENHDQVETRLAGFLRLRDFALAGLRAVTGLMLTGVPAGAEAASSGPGLKYTRHSGESSDFFATMQAVTRSTSGISELQSRNASPLQAACSSWV